jgi:hypothetical protein
MTLDEKIKILDKLRGGMSAAAVGLTFRWNFILKSDFPLIFNFHAFLSGDFFIILHSLFINKYHDSILMIFFFPRPRSRIPINPIQY